MFHNYTAPRHPSLIANNRAFHRLFVDGIAVDYRRLADVARAKIVLVLAFDYSVVNDRQAVNHS